MISKFAILAFTAFSCLPAKPIQHLFSAESKVEPLSKCALPPPNNFRLEWVGTYWVSIVWDPVPEAAYYRVKVYQTSTGALVASELVTAVPEYNLVVIGDLSPGQNYSATISSICSNGMESAKASVLH